jgi:hypothetical protein
MARTPESSVERKIPTRIDALIFRGKTALLQVRRAARNLADRELRQYSIGNKLTGDAVVAESTSPLWTESNPAERSLVAGKLENLRRAAARLTNLEVPAPTV